ncbi:SpdA2 protein [Streptomyces fumigatiscleroticus]|nr:SpdA2 protein [Streptomyces fumigatiscleroticus]
MRALLARVDAVLIQAVIAAALSFAHLHDIALAAGQDGWKAWAYPISVDLLLVAAWRRLRSGDARAAGWCWFVIALAASLGANVATAGLLDMNQVPAWLRILVAGWPAVAFLGGTLLAHSAPKTDDIDDIEPSEDIDAHDQEDELEAVPEPPARPAIEQASPEQPVAVEVSPERPALPVPAALVEHARKVATEHHTRTGTPIDTPTLRARLGVPAPMAEAIAAHL